MGHLRGVGCLTLLRTVGTHARQNSGQRWGVVELGWLEHDADGDDIGDNIGDEANLPPLLQPPDSKMARIVMAEELVEVQAVMRSA